MPLTPCVPPSFLTFTTRGWIACGQVETLDKKLSEGVEQAAADALMLEQKEVALQQVDAQLKSAKERAEMLEENLKMCVNLLLWCYRFLSCFFVVSMSRYFFAIHFRAWTSVAIAFKGIEAGTV